MRLPKLTTQGIIPVLTLLGILIMFIGIAVAIQLAKNGPQTQSNAQTPPKLITPAKTSSSPSPSTATSGGSKKTFSNLLAPQ